MTFSDASSTRPTTKSERIFLRLYLVMLGACFYFIFSDITNVDTIEKAGNSLLYRVIWLLLYSGLMVFSITAISQMVPRFKIPALLIFVSLQTFAFKGFEPESVMKLTMYMLTLLFGIWLAARFSFNEFFSIYYRLASYIAVIHIAIFPAVSHISHKFEPLARANVFGMSIYSGLFAHKNEAGLFFGIALVIGFTKLFFSGKTPKVGALLMLGLIFFNLGMSGAASPLISALFACAGIVALNLARRYGKAGIGILMILLPLPAIIVLNAAWFLSLFGRDLTLTGRSYAYESWFPYFKQHFIFGYGYGEFFSSSPNAPGVQLNAGKAYAHFMNFESGVLQTGIDFGGIGLIIMAIVFLYAAFRAITYSGSEGAQRYFPFGIVFFLFMSTLNEVYIVAFNTLTPALLFYIYSRFRLLYGKPTVESQQEAVAEPVLGARLIA